MSKQHRTFSGVPVHITLSESSDSKVPPKVQVMRCGTFSHPEYGKFEIKKEHLLAMKHNFEGKVRGVDLAIDYAHESEKVAAGWIKSVELSEDGQELWLNVEWTPKGEKVLSDKEFRYLSADFTFDFIHNETKKSHGPTLFGAGLTNRPVIKNMKPVIELMETENNNGGYDMDPKDQEIQGLKDKLNDQEAQMGEMQKKLAEYEAAAKKAEEEKALSEKKEKFRLLLSEKKAVPAQEEAFLAGDMVKFAELAKPLKLNEDGHGTDTTNTGEKSPEEQIMELAEKLVKEKSMTLGEAIRQVRAEKPDLRKKLEEKK